MKTVLVTGGCGFIASHLIDVLLATQDYQIINLDKLSYAADLNNTKHLKNHPRYRFVQADLSDEKAIDKVFQDFAVSNIFHLAAESHVDNSINSPSPFIQSNIVGTFNLLECARKYWTTEKGLNKENRFLHVSTDEVYGSLGPEGFFTEETPYQPNSPYSASKASSDMLVRCYNKTYGLNTVITNCSNNFGPRQHDEKLIPTVIRNATQQLPIPIYGQGTNIRDWLYVTDHCQALSKAFHQGKTGEVYNIGTHQEWTNLQITEKICIILDELLPIKDFNYGSLIKFVSDRPGHDFRYAIDSTKIQALGFTCEQPFEDALKQTVQWYVTKYESQLAQPLAS